MQCSCYRVFITPIAVLIICALSVGHRLCVLPLGQVHASDVELPFVRRDHRFLRLPAAGPKLTIIWEFPIRGTLLWGPYNKDPTI